MTLCACWWDAGRKVVRDPQLMADGGEARAFRLQRGGPHVFLSGLARAVQWPRAHTGPIGSSRAYPRLDKNPGGAVYGQRVPPTFGGPFTWAGQRYLERSVRGRLEAARPALAGLGSRAWRVGRCTRLVEGQRRDDQRQRRCPGLFESMISCWKSERSCTKISA